MNIAEAGAGLLVVVDRDLPGVARNAVRQLPARGDGTEQYFSDRFQTGRTHLARRADRESIAGDQKRLAAMDAGTEIGHQIAERAGLPAFVERLEALGHAIGGGRDLIGVDRVELLFPAEDFEIPEDERAAANDCARLRAGVGRGRRHRFAGHARFHPGGFDAVRHLPILTLI